MTYMGKIADLSAKAVNVFLAKVQNLCLNVKNENENYTV